MIGGLALLLMNLGKGEPVNPPPPGSVFRDLTAALLSTPSTIDVVRGQPIMLVDPTVLYQGPGMDTYTYFQVKQIQNGVKVSVQGSGVAGVHVGPATTLPPFHLVAADQPEPPDCPARGLCAYVWPGPEPAPICGAPPQPGYADAYLEIYQRRDPQDHDGFASPTCNGRIPIMRLKLANKVRYL